MPELADVLEDYAERWSDLTPEERIAALGLAVRIVVRLERRSAVMVLEEDGEDGQTVIRARPAKVGLDLKFLIGLVIALVTTLASSPVLLELLK